MTKEEVLALPRHLPIRVKNPKRICAIYFLFREGAVSYIGSTINLHGRMSEHISYRLFDEYTFIEVPIDKRKEFEKDYIIMFFPKDNRVIGKTETHVTLTEYLIQLSSGYREAFEEVASEFKLCTVGKYNYYDPEKLNPIFSDFKKASDHSRQLHKAFMRLRDFEIQDLIDRYLDK